MARNVRHVASGLSPGLKLVGNNFEGNISIEDGQRQAADLLLKHPLNGDTLPNVVDNLQPFPVAVIPNTAVTPSTIGTYMVDDYDLPPEGWKPPQLQ